MKVKKDFLLIIDMQAGFGTAKDKRTISNCISLINHAVNNGIIPVLFYFEGYGRLVSQIQSLVDNLERDGKETWHVWKYENDGSEDFMNQLEKSKYELGKVYACGVNLDACVEDTCMGLKKLECKDITILHDACNTNLYSFRSYKDAVNQSWKKFACDKVIKYAEIKEVIGVIQCI